MKQFENQIINKMIVVVIDPKTGNQSDFIFDNFEPLICNRDEALGRMCEEAAHRLYLRTLSSNTKILERENVGLDIIPTELSRALDVLCKALKEDEELYYGYQANIAVQFQDEMRKYEEKYKIQPISHEGLHTISNEAAKNFLNLLIGTLKLNLKTRTKQ